MFRISSLELALTCGLIVLVFIVPMLISRWYAQINKRLNQIEKKIDKKKE
jgi:flagellar biosynthesis protein FliR